MADSVEMQDIRGLDIDKAVKGFALTHYIFKNLVTVSSMTGDSVRWYQETAADLTATAPSKVANISPLSSFPTLEATWTRTTSYPRKYAAEGFLSMEDMKSSDIDVMARTLLRLTRAVVKQVDTRIWNVLTESQVAVNILSGSAVANTWASANANPIADILSGAQAIAENDYDPLAGGIVAMNPQNYKSLLDFLISTKGSSIPQFASEKVQSGVMMNLLGFKIVVSNNCTANFAFVGLPATACTWKSYTDTTSKVIVDEGIGSKVRVWEMGEAILTDPKAAYLIYNTGS